MSNIVRIHPRDEDRIEHVRLEKHGESQLLDINCSTGTLVELIEASIQSIQETPLCPQEMEILNACLTRAHQNLSNLLVATTNWGGYS